MIEVSISEKSHGSMIEMANREIFLRDVNKVYAGLVHKDEVRVVDKSSIGEQIKGVDALITKDTDLALCITVADCLPVFFWDSVLPIIGIAHAGWRGVEQNITVKVALKMKEMSCKNINALIGPSIGACHFEVKKDVAEKFPLFVEERDNKTFVDLKGCVKDKLKNNGVFVKDSGICTYCNPDRYFSYRRDKKLKTMLALILNKSI